ncbi:MAG: triose-phosphate isomerase, partial [Euryarchaeota archaeon]|nr:triose-phosphate isomerase [Euryarchaeota archaeon]
PSFIALQSISEIIRGSQIKFAAQNMRWDDPKITITGEVSPETLVEVGCNYVILGHSERRIYLNETNEIISLKVKAALKWGLIPIICIGEQYQERENGTYIKIIEKQINSAVEGLLESKSKENVVFAYEPAWSISTSPIAKPIDPQEANRMHKKIRDILTSILGKDFAESVTIVYGGSVNQSNVGLYFNQPEIDGGLVGTASQTIQSYSKIIEISQAIFSSKLNLK